MFNEGGKIHCSVLKYRLVCYSSTFTVDDDDRFARMSLTFHFNMQGHENIKIDELNLTIYYQINDLVPPERCEL